MDQQAVPTFNVIANKQVNNTLLIIQINELGFDENGIAFFFMNLIT